MVWKKSYGLGEREDKVVFGLDRGGTRTGPSPERNIPLDWAHSVPQKSSYQLVPCRLRLAPSAVAASSSRTVRWGGGVGRGGCGAD